MRVINKYTGVLVLAVSFLVAACEKHEPAIDYSLKVGNIYIDDGRIIPPEAYDPQQHTAVAVIVATGNSNDPFKALGVALDEWQDRAANMTGKLDGVSGDIDDMNGRSNTAAMLAAMEEDEKLDCPAAVSVSAYGEGDGRWHLPACGELLRLASNRQRIDQVLRVVGGKALTTDLYLSSTIDGTDEYSEKLYMRNVSLQEGRVVSSSRTAEKTVRPFILIR